MKFHPKEKYWKTQKQQRYRKMDLPCPDEKEDAHDEKDEALRGKDGVDDHELRAASCDQGARAAKAK